MGTTGAVVVAGGSGTRFGAQKQFAELGAQRLATLSVALARTVADVVVLVVPADYDGDGDGADLVTTGGATRSDSVRRGLAVLPTTCEVIVVHDAARPCASPELFSAVVDELRRTDADAVIPGLPVTDTVKRVANGLVTETLPRAELFAVQTPQAFRAEVLRRAHADAPDATDDAGLVEALGGRVRVVAGEAGNIKVTEPRDLAVLRATRGEA